MVDNIQPSPDASQEQAGEQGGNSISSIQRLKYARDQARQENQELRGMVTSLSNDMAEMRGRLDTQQGRSTPKELSDYTEDDLIRVATKDEHWENSPGIATQALLALMDKKQERASSEMRSEIMGTVQSQSIADKNFSDVQKEITKEYGVVREGTPHYDASMMKLEQQAQKYDKNNDLAAFVRDHPQYLLWSVNEAAKDLGISPGSSRSHQRPTSERNLPAPEDRLEGSSEASLDDVAVERETLDKLKQSGDYKGALAIVAKRIMRR